MNSITHAVNDNDSQHTTTHITAGLGLLCWFLTVLALAYSGIFVTPPEQPQLPILLSFASTFIVFALAYNLHAGFRRYVLSIDMRFLIMLHSWRMLGMGFVMLYMYDKLPGLFALLAGFGDALAAIGAVFLAYALFKRPQGVPRQWIWRWNSFGLLDFVVAVSIGLLTRSDALLVPESGVNSDMMTHFPLVLIPGFIVQVMLVTHFIIYLQLKNNHADQVMIRLQ